MWGKNCGQILNVIFGNLHPQHRLWNGQLFCLFVIPEKLDSGVPNPALISDFSAPNCEEKWFFILWIQIYIFQMGKDKAIQVILGVSRDFLQFFKDQITVY